jgi:hypothetical protein
MSDGPPALKLEEVDTAEQLAGARLDATPSAAVNSVIRGRLAQLVEHLLDKHIGAPGTSWAAQDPGRDVTRRPPAAVVACPPPDPAPSGATLRFQERIDRAW